jgi:hypothetical protein
MFSAPTLTLYGNSTAMDSKVITVTVFGTD